MEFNLLSEQETQIGEFLTFKLGTELFAIENSYVTEINRVTEITPLPNTPEYLKGILNLRGKIIPVIDMRLKLRKQRDTQCDGACVILTMADAKVGLVVDTVLEILSIKAEDIELPCEPHCLAHGHYLQGISKCNDDPLMILNCQRIVDEDEIFDLAQIVS